MYKFNNDKPIFIQVANVIELQIISGVLKSGDKIESVRDLAKLYSVNPNTIQKAMTILEDEGLVDVHRGVGRTISETKNIEKYINNYILNEVQDFTKLMKEQKVSKKFVLDVITREWENGNK